MSKLTAQISKKYFNNLKKVILVFIKFSYFFSQNFTFVSGKLLMQIPKDLSMMFSIKEADTVAIGVITHELGEFILKYSVLLQEAESRY